jgi:heat shock 70kDa protein 4
MAVCGLDFGNLSMLIAQTSKGGVDVLLNDASNRQTATCVSIQGKQRHLGDAGAAMARSNVNNTITCMKRLVGLPFNHPDVQEEIKKAAFTCVELPNGNVGVSVSYDDEPMIISAEHFLAMCLVRAQQIGAAANGNAPMGDCVMAVPASYTDAQRRACYHACEIANMNMLKVTNENNAVALSYGIFKSAKKIFSETELSNIMFIDLGYSTYSVSIVAFKQQNMAILSSVTNTNLGGRNYDDAIIEYAMGEFQKKTKIDLHGNKKAWLKLQVACEKAKKTLSPAGVSEAPINIECLAEDMDLNCILTKENFDKITQEYNDQLIAPIQQALDEAGMKSEQIFETEVVGGGSRVNMVKRTIAKFLNLDENLNNYGLKTTMNADEAVARGCALQCAMLSSRVRVQPFNIIDKLYYGIVATYDATSTGAEAEGAEGDASNEVKSSSAQLYNRNDDVPHKPRRLTFKKKASDFYITLSYDSTMKNEAHRHIAKYLIQVPQGSEGKDIRVTFNIDRNGCVFLQSAEMLEEIIEETKPVEESKPEDASDAKEGSDSKEGDAAKTEDEAKPEEAKPVATDATAAPAKKRFRKSDLQTVVECSGLTADDIKKAIELEGSMAFEDKIIVETADKRNELESYIYSMRDKMDGKLKDFIEKSEKTKLSELIQTSEDWLYDDGFDSTKGKYQAKLDDLYALSNPIEARLTEDLNRPGAITQLKKQIELCKEFAANYEEKFKHITDEDRDTVRSEVSKTEEWMFDLIGKQGSLNKNQTPVLTCTEISKKRNALFVATNPIMIKKAPAPAPAPAPEAKEEEKPSSTEEGSTAEGAKEGETQEGEAKTDDSNEVPPLESVPGADDANMDTSV